MVLLAASLPAQGDNILLIVADDLGVDYVGAYQEGTNPPPTPAIDGLAARGVLFRNAWANPSCSPTRAGLLTGRYPFRTLVGRWIAHNQNPPNVGLLQASERTVPELLDAGGSGYAHAMIGKWHLANAAASADTPRTVGGFSHFAGSLEGQIPSYTNWTRVVDGVSAPTTTYCTTQNTDDALAWIGRQQQGPWFCMLTYQAPHIPYHAPPAHLHTQNLQGLTPQSNHTPANVPFYRAMVESLDTEMGRLFAALGPAVLSRTNVVFVADNGTVQRQSVAPFIGTRAKGTPYEGGVNVPLIVAGPAVQQGGREVAALTCAVDLFATVLDLAGVAVPPTSGPPRHDSVSLMPYLQNPNQAPLRSFAYSEEFVGTAWPAPETNGHALVRNDRYKLIHRISGGDELYDLVADPFETANLIGSSSAPVQQARAALLAEIQRLRATGVVVTFSEFGASACPTSAGVPRLTWQGSTALGSTFAVNVLQVPGSVPAFFLLGDSATSWGGVALPLSLGPLGLHPQCELASSVDAIYPVTTAAWGGAQQAFTVPNSPALVDAVVHGAWAVADGLAPQNPVGLVTTRSLAITLGR